MIPTQKVSTPTRQREYLPYEHAHSVAPEKLVVVDCHYPRGLVLAHLYEDRVPADVRSNTSTETVVKAIEAGYADGREHVTCNHWDIDGFLAAWSLVHPELALDHRDLLVAAAMLGDFREFDSETVIGRSALKVCALLNYVEAKEFCLPFGDLDDATIEYQVAKQKFEYFLPRFSNWLTGMEQYSDLWQSEYDTVMGDLAAIDSGTIEIQEYPEMGLSVIHTPRPLHYYATCSRIQGGAILTVLRDRPYAELEYRYETRVGRMDKDVIVRRDLTGLAMKLTERETAPGIQWVFDNILLGGPMLRPDLIASPLSRELCYQSMSVRLGAHPTLRTNIALDTIEDAVIHALRD